MAVCLKHQTLCFVESIEEEAREQGEKLQVHYLLSLT